MNKTLLLALVIVYTLPINLNAQQYRSEVIKDVTHLEIRDKKLTRTESVTLQVNDRRGDQDGEIRLYYSKGDKLTIVKAHLEDKNGTVIRTLKNSEVTDRNSISDFSLYQDDFVKTFQLKHHQYPYRIIYTYKITTSRFLMVDYNNYWNYPFPVREKEIIVDVPHTQSLKYNQRNISEPLIEELDKTRRYKWVFAYTPPKKRETMASPNFSDAPYLYILTRQFEYGKKGSWDSWESYARWIGELNKNRRTLTDSEKQTVNKLIADAKSDREKAEILYEYVWNNTRYINVSIKLGGLQTYPASYVCDNKYGDCKALSNYYCALLEYAGIPSFYTLVDVGDRIKYIDESFPAQIFNHVITTIPLGTDTFFVDCTAKGLPFGYIPYSLQGRQVLLTGEEGGRLIRIPAPEPGNVISGRHITVPVYPGVTDVKIRSVLKGYEFEEAVYMMTQVNKNQVDNYLKNTLLTGSYTLADYDFERADSSIPEIIFTAWVDYHNVRKEYGKDILLQTFPYSLPVFELPEERRYPVQIDYPIGICDTISYIFRESVEVKLPDAIRWDTVYGHYTVEYSLQGKQLDIYKTIRIPAGRYPLEEYEAFYRFISGVRKEENKNLLIELL